MTDAGIAIEPSIVNTVLQRSIKKADRSMVVSLAGFWIGLWLLVLLWLWPVVPMLLVAIGWFVARTQRTTMKYTKAARLCADGADCVLERGRLLRVTRGQDMLELAIGPPMERALTLHLLPIARVVH